MLRKKRSITSLMVMCCIAVLSVTIATSPVSAKDATKSTKWRLQAHLPVGSASWEDSIVALANKVNERTGGRLQIELYPAGALVAGKEIFPAVKRGMIQMGYTSPAYLMDFIPTAGLAFAVPGAFVNIWETTYFWKHLGFEEMIREEAAAHDILYFTDKLYPTEMVLKKPVNSLAEFKSLKIRSAGMLQRLLTEVGAAASYIPGPEIYQALSTGVFDGAHWGASQEANALSLYEVAKYHVRPALGIGGVETFIINKKAMQGLPEDVQKILAQTLEEHFWTRTLQYQFQEVQTLKTLADTQGVQIHVLPEDIQARIREVGRKLRAEEAKKSEKAAEAVRRLEQFLKELGR